MFTTFASLCRACVTMLERIISALSNPENSHSGIGKIRIEKQLERLRLWIGDNGAMQSSDSAMYLESRLLEESEVLDLIWGILDDFYEAALDMCNIVTGNCVGKVATRSRYSLGEENDDEDEDEDQNEESELLQEMDNCLELLFFKGSHILRQAGPTDVFLKSLNRPEHHLERNSDVIHVGEAFPKLAMGEFSWLRLRLGRAITDRRQYLDYIRDHHGNSGGHSIGSLLSQNLEDVSSVPVNSYLQSNLIALSPGKVPKLPHQILQYGLRIECPFCYNRVTFESEEIWQQHVFSDLRAYVCTFPNCEAPYFCNEDDWFSHEMQKHRVNFVCAFCAGTSCETEEDYKTHVLAHHPDLLEIDSDHEEPVLEVARKPLKQIATNACPFCMDDHLQADQKAAKRDVQINPFNCVLYVDPSVFKRHLASHLQQLALSAIPERAISSFAIPGSPSPVMDGAIDEEQVDLSPPSSSSATLRLTGAGNKSQKLYQWACCSCGFGWLNYYTCIECPYCNNHIRCGGCTIVCDEVG
ncbi:unnamed protein product [Periconia digitata]|uniref:Oxidoreductase acuF-like C2H2 type zinc-finger domain-containing protein n=1 Tax=Periconia digitata TaxID=1303443 RepID=A0A9W4U1P8_9PLEO|nr:unnamed protein product [Periconia digitata]